MYIIQNWYLDGIEFIYYYIFVFKISTVYIGLFFFISIIIQPRFQRVSIFIRVNNKLNEISGLNRGEEPICKSLITLGNSTISNLPLSQTIFGFTFFYLLYFIGIMKKDNYVSQNIPTIIFFPLIILFDIIWNVSNKCHTYLDIMISLGLGITFGLLWGAIIESTKLSRFQYFNKISGNAECSRPSKSTFKCNVYKNGKLISSNMG